MPAQLPCPGPARLRQLLDGALAEPEQTQLVRHLDTCAGCQQTLEGMAANAASWSEAARLLTPDGAADPAITAEVPRSVARTVDANGETISLTFLAPPREAGHLGRLGHYEVLGVVGSGGMGVVLKAFDEALHRVVAIKVMAPQLAVVASARKRFSREARAAAAVTHEHVVTIHAVEEANDPPYLVMQYVAGVSLQERIDRTGPLQPKEILRIGMQAAQGLAAAHAQGLIHRDVKPANILLENGVERVKLTDFGLARMADDASVSQSGVIAGTPLYMAPEQARGEDLDARADLFSLGSVLYAMCTGRPPFRAGSPLAVLRRVCDDTPRPVREVNPDVPDWLVEIVARLHEKDPARRFQSAAEVAALLGRHLAHLQQPAAVPAPARLTRPAGPGGLDGGMLAAALIGFFVVVAIAGALVVATLGHSRIALAGGFVLGVGMVGVALITGLLLFGTWARAKRARRAAAGGAAPASPRPAAPRRAGVRKGVAALFGCVGLVWVGLALVLVTWLLSFRGCGTSITRTPIRSASRPVTSTTAFQPQRRAALTTRNSDIRAVTFSPDGNTLVAVSGTDADKPGGVEFWDASTLAQRKAGPLPPSLTLRAPHGVRCAAFSPDGRLLATGESDTTVSLRDPATGAARHVLVTGHKKPVTAVVFTPDSKGLVTASLDGTAKLWDLSTRQVRRTFGGHKGGVLCAALSRDGRTLATGGEDRTVLRWDVRTGKERLPAAPVDRVLEPREHGRQVASVAFSPDGRTLASGGWDGAIILWDAETGRWLATLPGHDARVHAVTFSPDSRLLASGGVGGTVKLWDVAGRREAASLRPDEPGNVYSLAFHRDSRVLAAGGWRDRVVLWDLGPPPAP